jgi:NADH:ubiquinone oxidoreductase subunit K
MTSLLNNVLSFSHQTQPTNFNPLLTYPMLRECFQIIGEHKTASTTTFPAWLAIVFVIFLLGLFGMIYNCKNFIVTIMCVEIMYLGAVSSFVLFGVIARDSVAAINGLLVLIFGACESAVGLGLLVAAFRFGEKIDLLTFSLIGG